MHKQKKEGLKALSKFQRLISNKFIKDYESKKIQKRKGECKKCGKCCENCKHLNKETKLCKIYEKRPILCYKNFPLFESDKKIWEVRNTCGYTFKK